MKLIKHNAPGWILIIVLAAFAIVPEPFLPSHAVGFREVLRHNGLNRADYDRNERGYYETLLDAGRSFGTLGESIQTADFRKHLGPAKHSEEDGRPILPTDDIREYVLKPNVDETAYGTLWQTNSRGLRDLEYSVEKTAETIRIAVLGDSITAGWGVTRPERFEDLWEVALNRMAADRGKIAEVWNFAVPGHSPAQRWKHFEKTGKDVPFDLVIYEATTSDPGWDARRMAHFMAKGQGLDDPLFSSFMQVSKFTPVPKPYTNGETLNRWQWTILQSVYEGIVNQSHKKNLPVAYVLIPRVGSNLSRPEILALLKRARSAGFDYVADLSTVFNDYDPEELSLSPGDYHPNIRGHRILAEAWEHHLAQWPALLDRINESTKSR